MDKDELIRELDSLSSRLPPNIHTFDAGKTRQWKESLKNAKSKRKSTASQLNAALHSLRQYYR